MAVYKHQYRRYEGDLTARWQRILIVPRYAYRRVFQSRFFALFFAACFVVPLGATFLIYLRHNLNALELLRIPADSLLAIDASFFQGILNIQGVFAFLLTVFVGPGLVSPDLTNNGLPLYLSRPFNKVDYVVGKMLVLLILQSSVTWVPITLLFLLQGSLAEAGWISAHTRILVAVWIGSGIWILFLSLLALAISAWVRWRAIGGALLFGVFFVTAGFSEAIKEAFRTRWGDLFNLNHVIEAIWTWLFFGSQQESSIWIQGARVEPLPVWSAFLVLGLVCLVCLGLLSRRIRAYEVIR